MRKKHSFATTLVLLMISGIFISTCICRATVAPKGVGAIEGQVKNREVIHWPEVSEELQQAPTGVTVKFWVKQNGSISKVEIQKKSGDTELDYMAMGFVREIRFKSSLTMGVQWGRITIPDKSPEVPVVEPKLLSKQPLRDKRLKEFQVLQIEVEVLRKLVVPVKTQNEKLKAENKRLAPENKELRAEVRRLKTENEELKADNMKLKLQGAKSRKIDSLVIASWKGSKILQKTPPFRVNKAPWTIVWSSFPNTDTSKRTCMLNVSIHKENGDLVDVAVDNLNYGGGIFLVDKTGTFYLSINSLFTNWRVRVLEDK